MTCHITRVFSQLDVAIEICFDRYPDLHSDIHLTYALTCILVCVLTFSSDMVWPLFDTYLAFSLPHIHWSHFVNPQDGGSGTVPGLTAFDKHKEMVSSIICGGSGLDVESLCVFSSNFCQATGAGDACRPVEWSFVRGLLEKRIVSRFTMIFDNALPQTFFEAHAVLVQLAKIEKEAVGLASLHGDVLPARHTILSAALKSLFGCIYLRELTNDQCHRIRAERALCFCWPGPLSGATGLVHALGLRRRHARNLRVANSQVTSLTIGSAPTAK